MNDIAQKLLQSGAVGVLPTDTVYGVVARAADQSAVERLYILKRREQKPGTIIAASIDQLVDLGIKRRYLTAVEEYWPASLSIVIPCGPELAYLHQGKGTLAVRVPDNKEFCELLTITGPLVTSSANQPGEPVSNTVAEAKAYFGDDVDFYEDGGDLSDREASTIIRVIDDEIEILRQGSVQIKGA